MSLKAKVEAIIYAAEEPVTLEQISQLLKDAVLADLAAAQENAAIERADAAAEAEASSTADADFAEPASEEDELLPELALDSARLLCHEPGPLMPHEPAVASPVSDAVEPAVEEPAAEDFAVASASAPETASRKRKPQKTEQEIAEDKAVRVRIREILVELVGEYASEERGIEIRQVAGGFRMATKPEHHDVVRAFAKSLKPPIRLSLAALETLAVIAYKQPITAPEIADIRGVESASVLGTLLDRKLITTAGRKQVIGRPMQYKTNKDFLLRFGLNDVNELPSMEEFSQLASERTVEIVPAEPQQTPSLFEPSAESATVAPSSAAESEKLEAHDQGSQLPGAQTIAEQEPSDATEAADSQPQPDADSDNVPGTEHPIGR